MQDELDFEPYRESRRLPRLIAASSDNELRKKAFEKAGYTGSEISTMNADMQRFDPEIRNPTLNPEQFFLPKFDVTDGSPNIELNVWFDHYYRFDPLIQNLIDLHSNLPLSRFGLVGITDNNVLNYYEEMCEDMELFENLVLILREWFKLGEVQPYAFWSEDLGRWTDLTLIDTNYITVTGHYMLRSEIGEPTEIYELEPDQYLQALVRTENIERRNLLQYLDPTIRMAIEQGKTLIIDPFSTTMIRRKNSPKDLRGTSILTSALKTLLLEDKLREQQYAAAQKNINPYTLWRRGNDNLIASYEELQDLRDLIRAAQYDTQFNIIADHTLTLQIEGAAGKVANLQPEFEYIANQKLTALWANKAFVHGEGPTYANASVGMRVLMSRYLPIRTMLENYGYQKLFLPVALQQDFFVSTPKDLPNGKSAMIKRSNKDRKPLIPRFDWRHKQSLIDDQSVRSMLQQLQTASKLPMKVICDSLDLDYDYVRDWLEKEMNTVFDNDFIDARKTLLKSAAAGGLKDSGSNMMKRIVNAATEYAKVIFKRSPNIGIEEKEKEDKDEEPKEQEKKEILLKYEKEQLKNIDKIIKKYSGIVERELQKENKGFKLTTNNRSLISIALKDNGYTSDQIRLVNDQLYDITLLLNKEGMNYLNKKTSGIVDEKNPPKMDKSLESVIESNLKEFQQRLYDCYKITAKETLAMLEKDNDYMSIKCPEIEQISLGVKINELESVERDVLQAQWNTIYPKLEEQVLGSFIRVAKQTELNVYDILDIKQCYHNGELKDISEIKDFNIETKLIPNLNYQLKKNIKIGEQVVRLPFELINNFIIFNKKNKLNGNYDLSNETFETIDNKLEDILIQEKYASTNNDSILDFYDTFYDDSPDDEQWFTNMSKRYIKGELQIKELEDWFKKIYK